MAVKVRIPTPFRTLTGGAAVADIAGTSVGEVLQTLSERYAGIDQRLFTRPGELNRSVSVFVNDEDVRNLDNLKTAVKDGDDVCIVPAIAGGLRGRNTHDTQWNDLTLRQDRHGARR
jgi:sulfur-carrier protein